MHRHLLLLLLLFLAAPLGAQDENGDDKKAETENKNKKDGDAKKEKEKKKADEDAQMKKRAEKLFDWIATFKRGDEKERKEAAVHLVLAGEDALPLLLAGLADCDDEQKRQLLWVTRLVREFGKDGDADIDIAVTPLPMRIFVTPDGGGEAMKGKVQKDGETIEFDLQSLGRGRYRLTATIKDKNDKTRKVEAEGTLAELRTKYAFLGRGGAFMLPGGMAVPTAHRGKIGLLVRPPAEELRYHLELPVRAGLVVQHVLKGSRADTLGLRRYDVLLRVDGELVEDPRQLEALSKDGVELQFVRRGKIKSITTGRR